MFVLLYTLSYQLQAHCMFPFFVQISKNSTGEEVFWLYQDKQLLWPFYFIAFYHPDITDKVFSKGINNLYPEATAIGIASIVNQSKVACLESYLSGTRWELPKLPKIKCQEPFLRCYPWWLWWGGIPWFYTERQPSTLPAKKFLDPNSRVQPAFGKSTQLTTPCKGKQHLS